MRVLITGGSGLIGSALAKYLIKKGVEVNILDKRKELPINGINLYQGSVLDKDDVRKAIKDCDYVYHLAAILGVKLATERALECLDVNVAGTRNVLQACVDHGVGKVIFASSSEVYGDPIKVPINEEHQLQPKSEYGVSKWVGEEYCKAFKLNLDLNYTIIRYCNVYGPNQALKFVMPLFIDYALADKPLEVYGHGNQIRSFCYVDDAVVGTELAMMNKKAEGHVFNIGYDKEPITIMEAAKRVLRLSGKEGEPVIVPFEKSDRTERREVNVRIPDLTKARNMLGYDPKISFEEGIKKVIDYRKRIRAGNFYMSPFIDY